MTLRAWKVVRADGSSICAPDTRNPTLHYRVGEEVSSPAGVWAHPTFETAIQRWARPPHVIGGALVLELEYVADDVLEVTPRYVLLARARLARQVSLDECVAVLEREPWRALLWTRKHFGIEP